jgi:hypothetical protein
MSPYRPLDIGEEPFLAAAETARRGKEIIKEEGKEGTESSCSATA